MLVAMKKYDQLSPPAFRCLVCQTDLSSTTDYEPLAMRYPEDFNSFDVFAYACRDCWIGRRDEVVAQAEEVHKAILQAHTHIVGFVHMAVPQANLEDVQD